MHISTSHPPPQALKSLRQSRWKDQKSQLSGCNRAVANMNSVFVTTRTRLGQVQGRCNPSMEWRRWTWSLTASWGASDIWHCWEEESQLTLVMWLLGGYQQTRPGPTRMSSREENSVGWLGRWNWKGVHGKSWGEGVYVIKIGSMKLSES